MDTHRDVVDTDASSTLRLRRLRAAYVVLAIGLVLLVCGTLYGAYGYEPAEAGRNHRPAYLEGVPSRFADTPTARFHYVRSGEGPPVVLVSPGSAWVIAWRHQLDALSEHHTVYVVDLPGQGYTELEDPNFGWNLRTISGSLGSFMDAVGIEEAALGGNSWSGGWALAFAQRHPDRVGRLVLLDSSGLDVKDPWQWEILKYPVLGELLTNLFTTKDAVRGAAENSLVNKDLVTDELVDDWWAPMMLRDNLRATYRLERGLDWRETEDAMPTTRTPTLVLWGEDDNVLPARQAERFGQLLPNAEVNVLEGCGHALQYDCPGRVNDLLEAFLDER